jgi:hypothetical protein
VGENAIDWLCKKADAVTVPLVVSVCGRFVRESVNVEPELGAFKSKTVFASSLSVAVGTGYELALDATRAKLLKRTSPIVPPCVYQELPHQAPIAVLVPDRAVLNFGTPETTSQLHESCM